jgi:hypothetical protein
VVSKLAERDQHAGRVQKGPVVFELVFISRDETAEVVQPRVGAFNNPAPAVAAQATAILIPVLAILQMRDDQVDAAPLETLPEFPAVICAIRHDALRLLFRSARSRARDRYLGERGFREVALGEIGRRKVHSERNTLAVDQYHKLCPLTLACFADASAPFFAGAKVPSMKASLQSSCFASSRSLRNARHNESQTSARSHSPSRRQHVAYAGYRSGRSFHRAPVRSTQRIPSIHARSSARGRPPLGFALGVGSTREIRAHWASDSSTFMPPSLRERSVSSHTIERRFRNHF